MKIALLPPTKSSDYLVSTVLDGLHELVQEDSAYEFRFRAGYPHPFGKELDAFTLSENDFIEYAKSADVIFLGFRYEELDLRLAEKIDQFDKTIFIDGAELKHNRRFDADIQKKVLEGTYKEGGMIQKDMLLKCALYLRREKPYIDGIVPFPFGIESRYLTYVKENPTKDIDFVCIFGQDEYPLMRRYAREMLIDYCKENNFSCVTDQSEGFEYDADKTAGRDDFYKTLARAKVGISIGGGGFDTLRFWETLGNNCLLLTEKIDIYEPDSTVLNYSRIFQFNNLFDFKYQLEKVGKFLREEYDQKKLETEYKEILAKHSTKSRVQEAIKLLKNKKK